MRMSVRAKKIEIFAANTQYTTIIIIIIWHFLQFTLWHTRARLPAAHRPQNDATAIEQMYTHASARQLFYQIFVSAHHRLFRLDFVYIFCMRVSSSVRAGGLLFYFIIILSIRLSLYFLLSHRKFFVFFFFFVAAHSTHTYCPSSCRMWIHAFSLRR